MEVKNNIKEKLKKPISPKDFLKKPLIFFVPALIVASFLAFIFITTQIAYLAFFHFPFFLYLLYYSFFSLYLQQIARKTGTKYTWFAWLPIARNYLMCKIAGRSGLLTLFFFIPIINLGVKIVVWRDIAITRGMSSFAATFIGILMLIPVVQLIPLVVMAKRP